MTQLNLFDESDQNTQFLKTSSDCSIQMAELIFTPCLNKSQKPKFQYVNVGQMRDWLTAETVKFVGESSTLNIGVAPSVAKESSLSAVLETDVPQKYYLSAKACAGILRRAESKQKQLPPPHFGGAGKSYGIGRDAFNCGENAKFGLSLDEELQPPLTSRGAGGVFDGYVVRRLTPRECERLQGLPDDWTAGVSDAQRYKMIGNGMAQPIADWILKQVIINGNSYFGMDTYRCSIFLNLQNAAMQIASCHRRNKKFYQMGVD